MKSHREFIKEQIEKNPKFAEYLAEADREVAIAVEIARAREQRGLSQMQLARLTGMKQPQIARMERGAYLPAFGTLVKVLGALDATLELSPTSCRVITRRRRDRPSTTSAARHRAAKKIPA